ncbi:hybrid sensor histidine kinase/response regulator [Rugamonas sp. DEMB1]|uniref:hybrid sensor histidine kinase/response regulator n=1 Tax=Rugamonas sp. DEMB1 TaxID=3039386 RepID=UPI0024485F1D|nr:hybrid sensor histidine kinase/response regulator [Rugamonas sp. DEMB1]WGG52592.1 ATP-binding protein [Rugamonas sp. DEMB1]
MSAVAPPGPGAPAAGPPPRRERRRNPLRWTGLSARTATALIGGALVVLLCATMLASTWFLRERAVEDWRQDMGGLALVLSENVAQTMGSTYLVLDSIVDVVHAGQKRDAAPLAKLARSEAMYQMMRDKISGLPQVDVATIVDAGGGVLNFTRSYPAPVINLADRDYFQHHRGSDDPAVYLSAPVRNKGNGKWTFYVSRRLNGPAGEFAGVVLVGVSCDFFAAFFRNVSLGEHAAITLYRRDHTLLARWPQVEGMMGKRVLSGTTYQVISQGKLHDVVLTHAPRESAGGRPIYRMGAVRQVRDYPLVVNATITEELLLAGWWRSVRLLGGVGLASLLVLLVAFWLMAVLLKRREHDAEEARELMQLADAASEAKSRFLAMMSHEIRTPMNGIVGMSELMLGTELDATQRGYARNVHSGVVELMHIINDVLDFSKVESGRMELESAAFDPAAHLRQVVELYLAGAAQKGLSIETVCQVGVAAVYADAGRIRQVLGNLVDNAIKFTPSGRVTVRLAASAGADGEALRLHYAVSDSGIGIAAEAQRRLFEPFSQADNTISRQYGGTGLGLAICKRLVELMGGHIDCVSVAERGTTFAFEIPCRLAPAAAADAMAGGGAPPGHGKDAAASAADAANATNAALGSGTAGTDIVAALDGTGASIAAATGTTIAAAIGGGTGASAAAAASAPWRVLVAEDTEMNRQLARILLTRLGCEVDEAGNGELALAALAGGHYDLVLMDCMMPVMDGYEATRRLREREAALGLARLPVIALTASAIEGDRQRCLAAGMDDYLAKPFTGVEFAAMVARWRSRPAALPAAPSTTPCRRSTASSSPPKPFC